MAVISILRNNGNNITKARNGTLKNIKINDVDYHFANKSVTENGICVNAVNEPLIDMQISGKSIQGILPEEYQQLDYIENSGTQLIDTGLIPTINTSVDIIYQTSNIYSSQYIAGSRLLSNSTVNYAVNGSSSTTVYDVRFTTPASILSSLTRTEDKVRVQLNLNNGNLEYIVTNLNTEESDTKTATDVVVNGESNLYLFAYNEFNIHPKLKIYSCKIYEAGILVRDYIPCYKKDDDIVGLYDLVNDVFYSNSHTNNHNFIKGNVVGTSVDAPLEIYNVGDRTKNLLDPSKIAKALNLDVRQIEDGIEVTQTASSNYVNIYFEIGDVAEYINQTLCFNGKSSGDFPTTVFYAVYGTADSPTTIKSLSSISYSTFQVPEEATGKLYIRALLQNTTVPGNAKHQLTNLWLDKSSKIDYYKPYGYLLNLSNSMYDVKNQFNEKDMVGEGINYTLSKEGITQIADVALNTTANYRVWLEPGYYILSNTGDDTHITISADSVSSNKLPYKFYVSTAKYVEFRLNAGVGVFIGHLQLEKVDASTTKPSAYTPFDGVAKTPYELYVREPLRGFGQFADVFNYKLNKVVRRIGKKVFDGTEEGWELYKIADTGVGVFKFTGLENVNTGESQTESLMSHFTLTTVTATADFQNSWYRFIGTTTSNSIYVSATQTTLEEFKTWLSINKPYLLYPLAEPIEEENNYYAKPNIELYDGDNTIIIDTSLRPNGLSMDY